MIDSKTISLDDPHQDERSILYQEAQTGGIFLNIRNVGNGNAVNVVAHFDQEPECFSIAENIRPGESSSLPLIGKPGQLIWDVADIWEDPSTRYQLANHNSETAFNLHCKNSFGVEKIKRYKLHVAIQPTLFGTKLFLTVGQV